MVSVSEMKYDEVKEMVLNKLKKELKPNLYYHNFQHTIDVCESVERIAELEEIEGEPLILLKTAAVFHDTGFIWRYDNNEELACEYARNTLENYQYQKQQIEKICEMIMATQIPQKPKDKLSEILCDADLDYVGRGDFFVTALRLHREWSENSNRKITFKDWYLKQQSFILQHDFFTKGAKQLREKTKKHNLSQIKELLNLLDTASGDRFNTISGSFK